MIGNLSLVTVILCTLLFLILGMMWIVGCTYVRKHWLEALPKFYLLLTAVRLMVVLTVAGVYILFISDNENESKSFALMMAIMYVAMMGITLKIKH